MLWGPRSMPKGDPNMPVRIGKASWKRLERIQKGAKKMPGRKEPERIQKGTGQKPESSQKGSKNAPGRYQEGARKMPEGIRKVPERC